MSRKKIGIITYYKDNYGSFLQCFALCTYLIKGGYEPVVLDRFNKKGFSPLLHKLSTLIKCVLVPKYLTRKLKNRSVRKKEALLLSDKSRSKINLAVEKYLNVEFFNDNQLRKIATSNEFLCFIAGSDQIWNCNLDFDYFKFLTFSPKEKNFAVSVSFGNLDIPKYNLSRLKTLLLNFKNISLREESAAHFIFELMNVKYERTADPSILLNKDEWSCYFNNNDKTKNNSRYIFAHFINKPSDLAVKSIKRIAKERNAKIIFVGYNHNLNFDYEFVDADPFEFLSILNCSEIVFTDSFHTTLFSINFEKEFYTFERCYLHKFSQSSRIYDLLSRYNLSDRLIRNFDEINFSKSNVANTKLILDRTNLEKYIDCCLKGEANNG